MYIINVFLPYFTDIQRIYILAANLSFALRNGWYFKFLQNPTEFLVKMGIKEENIYYIHPSKYEGENEEERVEVNNNFEVNVRLEELNDDFELSGNHRMDKGYVQVGYWMFKFFNISKDLVKFKKCINEKLNMTNIDLKNDDDIKDLKDCYKQIKGNFNDTSLVMLHKPLIEVDIHKIFCNCKYYCCDYFYRRYYCKHYCSKVKNKTFAQVLTGDIGLKNSNYKKFKQHYKQYLGEICLFQIPHHGAKENWNENILTDLKNCCYYVVSAGINNKYNHPSFKIFQDIVENNKCFVGVNESAFSRFILELRS